MNQRIRYSFTTALLLLCAGIASLAQAQPYDPYFSTHGGIAMPRTAETIDASEPDTVFDLDFDNAFLINAAVGLRGGNYRSELEVLYQNHDLDAVSASDATVTNPSGRVKALTGLVNAYYDFDTGRTGFTPYITGGLGYTMADMSIHMTVDDEAGTLNENANAFAFQLGVGVGYPISERVTVDLRYRYFSARKLNFDDVRSELRTHNFMAGILINL